MTYLVNDKCIKCKLTDCVDVCPVDCFYEGKNMLVIKPDECIDCGVCEPECPVDAIISDNDDNGGKWLDFGKKIEKLKNIVVKNIRELKKKHQTIIGYGAPAKATTALNYFNINNEINYIVEDNELKHGKFIPGVKIPVFSKEKIKEINPLILVLAWNFFDEIKKNNKTISKNIINIKSLEKNEIN